MNYILLVLLILLTPYWQMKSNQFNYMPYSEFKQKFQLGSASTEQLHPVTMQLSQTMHKDTIKGLELLLAVDENVINSFQNKIDDISKILIPAFKKSLQSKGRIFLIGSGSSGRLAIDLAAKANNANQVIGIIAGGDAAVVRAKEGFEDSENDGKSAIFKFNLNAKDTVVLISGSGSASFNVGCGNFAADLGANVYYFYNSTEIPVRTSNLFNRKNNPITPLLVDIGPQAISGSTRLQAATLAIIFLGYSLKMAFSQDLDLQYKNILLVGMLDAISKIKLQLNEMKKIILQEVKRFSNPVANFRRLRDYSDQGYVTMLAPLNSIREVFIDTTETSPTFSTNALRRESEIKKKRPEFQAYLIGGDDNKVAWQNLLAREIIKEDKFETMQFLLSNKSIGFNSYSNRPTKKGNMVFGVCKLLGNENISDDLITSVKDAKINGATTIMLMVCDNKISDEQLKITKNISDLYILLEDLPNDDFGIIHSFALKIILNLISNSSMILMNKVFGNRMIDVNPSNYKLVDRSMRIITDIWKNSFPANKIDDENLYNTIQQLYIKKKERQEQGLYVPSIINITLNLLHKNKTPDNFEEILDLIEKNNESLSFLDINWS
ncbi:MAG: hypothetical protein P4L22_06350 [Candidatus Babeliales bacterium]|nr:hypothetical protein [Candidatus Babeliales bacterium]